MKTINEILQDYTAGKTPLEETNAALAENEAGYHLNPGKNTLREEEIRATTVGTYPDMANGWGLMDTGTGTLDKVHVVDGVIQGGPVNEVREDGELSMKATVYIGGKQYAVAGDKLAEIAPKEAPWWAPYHTFTGAVAWQDELPWYIPDKDMMYRPKYSGQEVVKGGLRYIYDDAGNAKYQPKSMREYDQDHGRA